ncbi:clathrin interactor EPSIN 3-like isoform X2 [Primulina tabacum]|uniref:clathrin interactor EPSIN 3-like isoform X2 n=1 Tax=Primulina tabacum TaxID=48773 RepID=UPI003F5A9005
MKKAFDQTVRDIKREVNKKVLKVPSIEQKVLDATSNEPWGPHGSLLADIAQATRNYHEYQMIMGIIWKRINDTGKNWRHVYKGLTVLEYLVAHGSERVIDEIREHAYQISTLSDFQYIDSSGRDQGNNVRKKSQSIVALVNDKERIQEVRQKAAANRDKYRNSSMDNMYRPGSFSRSGGYGDKYEDDRYESRYGYRDDDRSGYGGERDFRYGDDREANYGGSYGREGDRYGRDYEDRYNRDGFRDDDYRGRGQRVDEYAYGSRSRSADPGRDRSYEDDGQYSSRGSGAKADDQSQDGSTMEKRLDRKYSEQNLNVPPSYEEAVNATHIPTNSERDWENSMASAPRASSPSMVASPSHATAAAPLPAPASPPTLAAGATFPDSEKEVDGFDEFDPRGSFSAASTSANVIGSTTSADTKMDLVASLALVPVTQSTMTPEVKSRETFTSEATFAAMPSASSITDQLFADPFGDGPFKAIPSTYSVEGQRHQSISTNSFNSNPSQISGVQPVPQKAETEFPVTYDLNYVPSDPSGVQPHPRNQQSVQQDLSTFNQDDDILADILPLSVSSSVATSGFPTQLGQSSSQTSHPPQLLMSAPQSVKPTYPAKFPAQMASSQAGFQAPVGGQSVQSYTPNPNFYGSYQSQMVSTGPDTANMVPPSASRTPVQHNLPSQIGSAVPGASQFGPPAPQGRPSMPSTPASRGLSAVVPQPSKDKFETKSTVWADTLSRGLVNLNISGSKTNPLADIGVDFDALNRKDKRMEKPMTASVASTTTMGKAMGSGSGMGRAGAGASAGAPRPSPNLVASGVNMNTSGVRGAGMGIAGSYQVSQPMVREMNVGMAQGIPMQQQAGFPSASTMPGSYNPVMGTGNYSQRPQGGGY